MWCVILNLDCVDSELRSGARTYMENRGYFSSFILRLAAKQNFVKISICTYLLGLLDKNDARVINSSATT